MTKDRKIILIEPPFIRLYKEIYSLHRYPLGIASLAATVKERTDWEVLAYNSDFSPVGEIPSTRELTGKRFERYLRNLKDPENGIWREISDAIAAFGPAVVGISTKSQNFQSARNIARIAKELDPRSIVVLGGPHPSMAGAAVLSDPHIDVAAMGEGEETLVELLGAIAAGRGFEGIRGIAFRAGDRVVTNEPRPFIADLDSLPFPNTAAPEVLKDHHLYPSHAFSHIFTARGCPYNCYFCGSRKIWSRKPRRRSPENIVREIEDRRAHGIEVINFEDDTFGIDREHIRRLCALIAERCPGIRWSCELHVKLCDDEVLEMLRRGGCTWISIGIESGSDEILRKIRKGITIDEAVEACRSIVKHGISLGTFFMVGFPWETEETLEETIRAMRRCPCDIISYSIFTPYPGTEAFDHCRDQGAIDENFDVSLYNHQSPANCFSLHIPHGRFRQLLRKIEVMTDRKIRVNRICRAFSWSRLRRVRELGIRKSLEKGKKILLGRN
jgi:anaerobic magnesium-protoporphyrin IX monomethyl ester cyclase